MGISGLLQGLQSFTKKGHIRDYSGQALAVDASSWMYKSVYSIAELFVESTEASSNGDGDGDDGKLDPSCIQTSTNYIVSRCQELLLSANISRIYLVMDGLRCPLKAETNRDREARRLQNLHEARRYQKEGQRNKAQKKYNACIKVRPNFTRAVMEVVGRRVCQGNLKTRLICVWAPYEADAQLVKLCWEGLAHAIVTEDSDLLLYTATCRLPTPILFKLDRDTGNCDILTMEWLLSPKSKHSQKNDKQIIITLDTILNGLAAREERVPGAGVRQFIQACVLAGCDYAPRCKIGLIKAFSLIRDQSLRNPSECFRYVLSSLPKIAFGYEETLSKSEAVFYYHSVFDAKSEQVTYLQPPNTSQGDPQSLTEFMPSLVRFSDWSFLGTVQSGSLQSRAQMRETNKAKISGVVLPNKRPVEVNHSQDRHMPRIAAVARGKHSSTVLKEPMFNPYRAAKRPRHAVDVSTPSTGGIFQKSNPFASYSPGLPDELRNVESSSSRKSSTSDAVILSQRSQPDSLDMVVPNFDMAVSISKTPDERFCHVTSTPDITRSASDSKSLGVTPHSWSPPPRPVVKCEKEWDDEFSSYYASLPDDELLATVADNPSTSSHDDMYGVSVKCPRVSKSSTKKLSPANYNHHGVTGIAASIQPTTLFARYNQSDRPSEYAASAKRDEEWEEELNRCIASIPDDILLQEVIHPPSRQTHAALEGRESDGSRF